MMQTQDAIKLFIADCYDRGLAQSTINQRASHLKHFKLAFPELPIDSLSIHRFLTRDIKKKSARYEIRKTLLALYGFLERQNISANPIPPGKVGRPKKGKSLEKLGRGGSDIIPQRIELHIYIHQAAD